MRFPLIMFSSFVLITTLAVCRPSVERWQVALNGFCCGLYFMYAVVEAEKKYLRY